MVDLGFIPTDSRPKRLWRVGPRILKDGATLDQMYLALKISRFKYGA